mgnify:CR=1 FL=1
MEKRKVSYRDYHLTIKLRSKINKEGKPKMIPKMKWVDRTEDCQPILRFGDNKKKTHDIGLVLERLLIIDIDVNHNKNENGFETLNEWIKRFNKEKIKEIGNDMKNTMRVDTPSGGMHIYFMLPTEMDNFVGKRKVKAMSGIDLLTGNNSYVPAPGSIRADGFYAINETSDEYIMEAPQWVLDLFESDEKQNVSDTSTNNDLNRISKHADTPLRRIFQAMQFGFEKGERNERMTSIVGTLVWYVANEKFGEDDALFIVDTIAKRCNPPMEQKEWETIWNSVVNKANQSL